MPARYVHMVDADVEKAIFERYGIKEKEEKISNQPQKCLICDMYNSAEATVCSKCGKPLDLKTALSKEEEEQNKKETLQKTLETMKQNQTHLEAKYDNLMEVFELYLESLEYPSPRI